MLRSLAPQHYYNVKLTMLQGVSLPREMLLLTKNIRIHKRIRMRKSMGGSRKDITL